MGIWKAVLAVTSMLVAAAAQADLACDKTTYDPSFKKKELWNEPVELIVTPPRIIDGGKILCRKDRDLQKNINTLHRIEEGSLNGVKYSLYYQDGSGSVQGVKSNALDILKDSYDSNWSTRCKVDSMDDSRWCAMSKGPLTIGIWQEHVYFITVGSDHFPGSKVLIRTGQSQPISKLAKDSFTNAQVTSIIQELKIAKTVKTRYREWPYDVDKDKEIDLFGFNEGLQIITTMYNKIGAK